MSNSATKKAKRCLLEKNDMPEWVKAYLRVWGKEAHAIYGPDDQGWSETSSTLHAMECAAEITRQCQIEIYNEALAYVSKQQDRHPRARIRPFKTAPNTGLVSQMEEEVYSEVALYVVRALAGVSLAIRQVLFLEYAVREKFELHVMQKYKAGMRVKKTIRYPTLDDMLDVVGLEPEDYYRRLREAHLCVHTLMPKSCAHKTPEEIAPDCYTISKRYKETADEFVPTNSPPFFYWCRKSKLTTGEINHVRNSDAATNRTVAKRRNPQIPNQRANPLTMGTHWPSAAP